MGCIIGYWHVASGIAGLSLQIYGSHPGGIVNGAGGDALAEPNAVTRPAYYQASVAETIASGVYRARILKAGIVQYDGKVRISGTGTYDIDDGTEGTTSSQEVTSFSEEALAQLASQGPITITVPTLAGNHLSAPLVRGDSYLDDHERAIVFSRSDFPDLQGTEIVRLTARNVRDASNTFSITGSIAVASGTKVLKFEPTSAQTAGWTPGKYEFDVEVEFADGNVATFVGPDVYLRVLNDVTEV